MERNAVMMTDPIRQRYELMAGHLNEHQRRLWAGAEARVLGWGGIGQVSRATGLSRGVVAAGRRELSQPDRGALGARVRQPGGGRKRLTVRDPTLKADLERLVEPTSRGEPDSPLRWTCKSTRHLAAALRAQGHRVGHTVVAELLHRLDYSLQADRKIREGGSEPDRDAQFAHLNAEVIRYQAEGQPVISVDAKKRELIGSFKNAGRDWHPKGCAPAVNVYDFPSLSEGKALPYGVYDLMENTGWVNVGTDHDTAVFAVASIRQWWATMGQARYPQATRLLITADGGGSNGSRNHLWKWELQRWADESGLTIRVCHFPPGTSKWNKIEHRLFSAITQNWRGQPLVSYETVIQLIGATHTRTGLTVQACLDQHAYPTGIKISDDQMSHVHLQKAPFHGEWNYAISPGIPDKT
jgi:hypothetical protein